MPFSPRPHGQVMPALDDVNDRIRHLMDQPAGKERSATYADLLALWAEVTPNVTPDDIEQAA